jgi:hypothetical protein
MILGLLADYWKEIVIAIAVAIALAFVYGIAYTAGSDSVMERWNKAKAEQAQAVAAELARQKADFETKLAIARAAGEVAVVEVERVREVTRTIVEKVNVYVPVDSPPLPAGFGVLHDAAASGTPAPDDPASAIAAYGAGPSPQDVAETVIGNYGTYHEVAARLHGLQRYVREVCQATR